MGKFGPKKSKLSVLIENWYTWYLGNADSESGLRFLKFRPQNPFLGKFGPKKSKLSVFPENWHGWHLDEADSYYAWHLDEAEFLFQNLFSEFPTLNPFFGQIWAKTVVQFG